jgi:hypothetical protein
VQERPDTILLVTGKLYINRESKVVPLTTTKHGREPRI